MTRYTRMVLRSGVSVSLAVFATGCSGPMCISDWSRGVDLEQVPPAVARFVPKDRMDPALMDGDLPSTSRILDRVVATLTECTRLDAHPDPRDPTVAETCWMKSFDEDHSHLTHERYRVGVTIANDGIVLKVSAEAARRAAGSSDFNDHLPASAGNAPENSVTARCAAMMAERLGGNP